MGKLVHFYSVSTIANNVKNKINKWKLNKAKKNVYQKLSLKRKFNPYANTMFTMLNNISLKLNLLSK